MRPAFWLASLLFVAACSEPHSPAETKAAPPAAATVDSAGFNSTTVKSLPLRQLPAGVPRQPGKVLEMTQWTDANGPNLLLISRSAVQTLPAGPDDPNDVQSVSLYARQYVQRAGKWKELWHLQDGVERCAFDMWLGPVPGAVAVTDLDADGRTETTLVYKLVCRSDVSPADLKLIMREGPDKYALRGHTVVQYDSVPAAQRIPADACCLDTISAARLEEEYELLTGRYETEKEFRQAPPAFLRFARQHWRRWVVEQEMGQL
ncbi:M949_RS01915 family surface polysaccharide biosynthesis protein [Hymenobacter lutimineralis]|uniref:M949_RS01915 family surface polysaccharide biosynthesis protein n=1 Tax=Hymenobacter lutimineralis TaxID=2606448 RepID=UPI003570FE01